MLLDRCTSKCQKIQCGVPQLGSILGRLHFLLFFIDLPTCLQYTNARMYAAEISPNASSQSTSELLTKAKCDLQNVNACTVIFKVSI